MGVTHAILEWAATVPHLVEAPNLPTDIRGKEGRFHRKPVGVVGLISPWNWPLAPKASRQEKAFPGA
jgi:acyl-CoA reductase-like NAD-dependent aldehyde dehydrogenase